jgi:hypothetical protein
VSVDAVGLPLDDLAPKPTISFVTVRWITEIPDPEDETSVEAVEMFSVVGEQYRLASVQAAAKAISDEPGFLPPRFWLVPEDTNQYDDQAVAVYATTRDRGYHVGFLPKEQARGFRANMASINRPGESLEVLGCITQGKSSPHPNARVYMPADFAILFHNGYMADAANRVKWLEDPSPVAPRALRHRISEDFTFEEFCKIYCWHARRRNWFCFPDDCESKAEGLRSAGIGLPRKAFDPFLLPSTPVEVTTPPATTVSPAPGNHFPSDASKQWFFLANGEERGPLDAVSLKQAAETGELGPADSVRRGDMVQWVPATRVRGLFTEDHAREADGPPKQSDSGSCLDLRSILHASGDLSPPWAAGEFQDTSPKMFDSLPPAVAYGSCPMLLNGKQSGVVTGFVLEGVEPAVEHYKSIERMIGSTISEIGLVARLGQRARFSYMKTEMPPQLKLPPVECSEVVFHRDSAVVHVRMVGAQPEVAIDYAVKIDARLIR